MPFPVSITGKIEIPRESMLTGDLELLKRRAVETLELLTDSVTDDGMIVRARPHWQEMFHGKIGRGHAMVTFDDIDLQIVQSMSGIVIKYRLHTKYMLRIVLCACGVFFVFWGSISADRLTLVELWMEGARMAGLAFGWLFGMNYLFGWYRGPRWLKRHLLDPKASS